MATQAEKAQHFLALHHTRAPLLMPNPWDVGSARVLASLGFEALATTSSGNAATLGQLDGSVTRDQAIAHGADMAAATDLPVSADLENGFADVPEEVAATVNLAIESGLAGGSIEDYSGSRLYPRDFAVARVAAAAEAAHRSDSLFVLTARAENHIRGNPDLADTIARLQAFQEAGADVLYAPGLSDIDDIRTVVAAVDLPVNVLALPNAPNVAELGMAGVKRISVGSGFAFAAIGALTAAAREFGEQGTYEFWNTAGPGANAARSAFTR
jgi:2-methylisocitrate lyase-like PEP mutase family enzyme